MFRVQESNRSHGFRDVRGNINFQAGHPAGTETNTVPAIAHTGTRSYSGLEGYWFR